MKGKYIGALSLVLLLMIGVLSACTISGKSDVALSEEIKFIYQETYKNVQAAKTAESALPWDMEEREAVPKLTDGDVKARSAVTKDGIYDKMLNTVDYFTQASITFQVLEPNIPTPSVVTIETNLDDSTARQKIETYQDVSAMKARRGTQHTTEELCNGEYLVQLDHQEKTYYVVGNVFERREREDEYPQRTPRFFIDEEGVPNYQYRTNSTNAFMSSYSLFPQELTFGLLTDQSLWEITGEEIFLGRNAVVLKGTPSAAYGAQLKIASFTLVVDAETGILLKYDGFDENGMITSYTNVTAISIDQPNKRSLAAEFSMDQYADYEELEGQFFGVLGLQE